MTTTEQAELQAEHQVAARIWTSNRQRMYGLAYRMLGSACDAEDVLQEAYLRLRGADVASIEDPPAWLTTVVARLALNELASARRRREAYVGPWSPEPVAGGDVGFETAALAESISAAFLVVLEELTPAQRVAFVLHDVFGYPYSELALILGRSEGACRHLVSRARRLVRDAAPRFESDADRRDTVARAFLRACQDGDIDTLMALLAGDVAARADGGGKARAARRTVRGADRTARLLAGILERRPDRPLVVDDVNGCPGLAFVGRGGQLRWLLVLSIGDGGLVQAVDIVTNPDKLDHLQVDTGLQAATAQSGVDDGDRDGS